MDIPLEPELLVGDDPCSAEDAQKDKALLDGIAAGMRDARSRMLGFPVNLDFDYRHLADFLAVHGNNAGSPLQESEYLLHTKKFERAVTDFFARLAGASGRTVFGHVTNGGTESNIFGVYVGRERHPDAILYASAEAHYSIPKIARLLRIPYEPVQADASGAMDLGALRGALSRQAGKAAVAVATIGTTGQGAVDDLPGIREALAATHTARSHLHSDAAFGGPLAALGTTRKPWGFEDGADSIAISGHKMIGTPVPCGIVLARPEHVRSIRIRGTAVGSDDDTIGGSRDAFTPVLLWQELRKMGRRGLAERVQRCVRVAAYAAERLEEIGRNPFHLPGTNTVIFDAPAPALCDRWHLLCDDGRAHLNTMPHVTEEIIDRLCADLTAPKAGNP